MRVEFKLNGKLLSLEVEPALTLLQMLRHDLGLKGTKEGCGKGECGACTVLLNKKAVLSCLILIPKVQGRSVTTIEGLETKGELHPLQKSFIENGAVQCGFCTPGMILSAKACLNENPYPSTDEIRRAISGNLCRCTGYLKIIQAIRSVSGLPQKQGT